jgi:beta-glucanase (GH16 family)
VEDACGPKLAKTPGSTVEWSCTLNEDFDGSALDADVWSVQTTAGSGFGVGGECFVDDPDNVSVGGGNLSLTVRKEDQPHPCQKPNPGDWANPIHFETDYTAGSVLTDHKFSQAYGRFEIRAKMPSSTLPGLQFAFWLWPQDLTNYPVTAETGRWANGEIDIMEWYSTYPHHGVPFLHYAHTYVQGPNGNPVPDDPNLTRACLVGTMADWHTYTLEWTPTSIRILYDGVVCLENTSWTPSNTAMPGPFDKPFMISLTQALGALGTANQVNPQTPLPATATIDYVKVWE